jgi:hypothetical protein
MDEAKKRRRMKPKKRRRMKPEDSANWRSYEEEAPQGRRFFMAFE